jgi:hypothetical protein
VNVEGGAIILLFDAVPYVVARIQPMVSVAESAFAVFTAYGPSQTTIQ